MTLAGSWGLTLLGLCIENFILAEPKERGPFYGISSYWCWISPKYIIERYTTDYLFMIVAAVFSFILYSLVFFRLRGNISVSAGYKLSFHQRPKFRISKAEDGTYIMTDDRHVASYLTTVAKHMLWYPIVYTILVLPVATSRLSTFSSLSVPFSVTIFTAAVFMLHGFVNTVLFCATRNILPSSWRQRFVLGTLFGGRGNATWSFTSTRIGTFGAIPIPTVMSVDVEKDVEVKYDAKFSSPTPLPQAYGGSGKQANAYEHHMQRLSFPAPQDTRTSIRSKIDGDDEYDDLGVSGI